MIMKSKILKKISVAFLMICMLTPVHADKTLNTGSDMKINIKSADNKSELPTKPDTEVSTPSKDKGKVEGKLPATGQSSLIYLASGALVVVGGVFLIHSRLGEENHDDA